MRKILTLLTASILTSTPTVSIIGCGNPSPAKINGKENIGTEFTLTNDVIVTDDSAPVMTSIIEQAQAEKRISAELKPDIFVITDHFNLTKPDVDNTPQNGWVVLTVRDQNDIPYNGSITIHFTLIKKASIKINDSIQLNNVWDITKYDSINDLYQDIWEAAINDFKDNTPTNYDTYDMGGFSLPENFNQNLDVEMIAVYNGKANTPTASYSGNVVIKLKIISYRAEVDLKLKRNNLPSATLYDAVWAEVKTYFATDVGTSDDRNDYIIDWSTVTEPAVGEFTVLNFLATPKQSEVHHYIRVIGKISKNPIQLPEQVTLPNPIVVTQLQRPNLDKEKIWHLAMQEANLEDGPQLDEFDTSKWESILSKEWPSIGGSTVVELTAKNLNINLMYSGDIKIIVHLVNEGTAISLLSIDPISLLRDDNDTVDSVLKLVWEKVINTPEWNSNLSKDLSKFKIDRKNDLQRALETAQNSGTWGTYTIFINGNQEEGSGRDVEIIVNGKIRIVDN
ncbi:hypothetical protein [Spiroplasma endosymbiont of Stenodema calcarata]|uniref:hypothetical protein n=1 Tax=Spiroplasma endosymbiont of Stenodema calcarata TaxID=3139328 RepID=UPI003CCA7828